MNLIDILTDENHLLKAWKLLNKNNEESHGLSGETISTFGKDYQSKISAISKKLKKGYKFKPTRAFCIPKKKMLSNGQSIIKQRPLQIPEIEDRVVLKAISLLLEEKFEHHLIKAKGISFAYQKEIGVQDAIAAIQKYYNQGYKYVLETDLDNFFPSVNKESLLKKTFEWLENDTSINELIQQGISQNCEGLEKINKEHHSLFQNIGGIPQGNPLSPIFSNIYLLPFDLSIKQNPKLKLVRYADDFVVITKNKSDIENCRKVVENELTKIDSKLKLKPEKTNQIEIGKDILTFLSISFDGKQIYPSEDSVERFLDKIDKICFFDSKTVKDLLEKVFYSLDGWIAAYHYTDVGRYFEKIDCRINKQLFAKLTHLGWKFSKKSKGIIPREFLKEKESIECLSKEQRINSGVPLCKTILEKKLKKKKFTSYSSNQ